MRPQVVAHRGASYDRAEHTLGAYVAALDVGAEALECDVRLTADGHLVCVHDRDLRRPRLRRELLERQLEQPLRADAQHQVGQRFGVPGFQRNRARPPRTGSPASR